MFNPLSLQKNDQIKLASDIYICHSVLNFTDAQNSLACRYKLFDKKENKEIWLEVKKDRALNYQLFYYEKVKYMDYDPSFLALVGTQTIGYSNPNEDISDQTVYNRIPKKGEVVMPIKHLVSEDELPQNPKEHGYYKDANGNWYFMTKRSNGTLKKFDNSLKIRSWEYKHKQNRLLIEMQDQNSLLTNITIYEGKEIARRDLKKI
jgi:hypothetical protein